MGLTRLIYRDLISFSYDAARRSVVLGSVAGRILWALPPEDGFEPKADAKRTTPYVSAARWMNIYIPLCLSFVIYFLLSVIFYPLSFIYHLLFIICHLHFTKRWDGDDGVVILLYFTSIHRRPHFLV